VSVGQGSESTGRAEGWQRLESLCRRAAGTSGVASLTEQELWELPSLYRRALADLSLLRANGTAPHEQQYLSQLCNRAHAIVYAGQHTTAQRQSVLGYLLGTLPATMQRRKWYVFAAAAVMLLFAAAGLVHAAANPEIVEKVLPPQMYHGWQAQLETARDQSDLKLAAQIEREQRPFMAFQITLNNVRVSVNALMLGILGGVPSLIVLGFNGYMVGVLGYLYFTTQTTLDINLPLYFIAGIAPHGSIELPAICVASGAGMLIGFAWLFPGQRGRGDNLRAVFPDAMRMLLVTAITLVVAGSIEGFITPLYPPTGVTLETWFWAKIVFGALVFIAWLSWLGNPKAQTLA
jgi:uncharacterized membrane protein SpoIIM required for sporulation